MGGVPAAYADAWARPQIQKPMRVSDAEWRQAIGYAGRFLDAGLALHSNSAGRAASFSTFRATASRAAWCGFKKARRFDLQGLNALCLATELASLTG